MPESMYDKLGDLLNAALDSGFILGEKKRGFSPSSDENSKKTEEEKSEKAKEKEEIFQNEEKQKNQNVDVQIPENVKNAFSKIQIPEESDFESAKKIYREKLKFYHPDRRNDNPVLQKVAKEKTEQLLSNWKIVENYFKNL